MTRLPRLLPAVAALALTAPLLAGTAAATAEAPAGSHHPGHPHRLPRHLALPDGFQPEGIAVAGRRVLVSSKADGDVYAIDARTGQGSTFAQGPGTPSLGLEVDRRHHRLYVAGGTGGDARVLDLRTGRTLAEYPLTTNSSFVNDQVVAGHAVWFTDSAQAQLYRIPLGRRGALPAPSAVTTVPLRGAWRQVDGTNANGIVRTPDGHALLVVNSATGRLYRVSYAGRARVVRGVRLRNGDGLLLRGRTLYAVRNADDEIAVVHLDRHARHGHVARFIRDRAFDVPSTVAARGRDLYLPNARFSTTPTPTTTYSVNRVRLH